MKSKRVAKIILTLFAFLFLFFQYGIQEAQAWWSSNYSYREKITVTNNDSVQLAANTIVAFTANTQTLISGGKLRSDGKDWRIVYFNGSTESEIAQNIEGGWNSTSTETWFRLQAAIAASGSNDNYYVYYGYSSESTSPSTFTTSEGTITQQTTSSGALDALDYENTNNGEYGGAQQVSISAGTSNYWKITKFSFSVYQKCSYCGWPCSNNDIAAFIFSSTAKKEGNEITNGKSNIMDADSLGVGYNNLTWSSGSEPKIKAGTWYFAVLPTNPAQRNVSGCWFRWGHQGSSSGAYQIDKAGTWHTSDIDADKERSYKVYGREAANSDLSASLGAEHQYGKFLYRRKITIDRSKVTPCSADLSNFPLLISESGTWLKTNANGGDIEKVVSNIPYDIVFRALDGTTQLDHEIEKYDGTNGTLVAWVKVSTVNYSGRSSNTEIYIYYGNDSVTTDPQKKTGVWDSNYKAVYHLKETSGTHYDSTGNANNSTSVTLTTQGSATGTIDGADEFNGSSNHIVVGDSNSLDITNEITIEAWIVDDLASSKGRIVTKATEIYVLRTDWSGSLHGYLSKGSTLYYAKSSNGVITQGTYQHVALTWNGVSGDNKLRLYRNGSEVSSYVTQQGVTSPLDTSGNSLYIGSHGSGEYWDGKIDEVRVSDKARDACWIGSSYNSMYSPSTFYSIETSATSPAPTDVMLTSFTAIEYEEGKVLLEWRTGYEVNNLGFHVYREEGGQLYELTSEPIKGSALLTGHHTATAGYSYTWWDTSAIADVQGSLTLKDRPSASRTVPPTAGLEANNPSASSEAHEPNMVQGEALLKRSDLSFLLAVSGRL